MIKFDENLYLGGSVKTYHCVLFYGRVYFDPYVSIYESWYPTTTKETDNILIAKIFDYAYYLCTVSMTMFTVGFWVSLVADFLIIQVASPEKMLGLYSVVFHK